MHVGLRPPILLLAAAVAVPLGFAALTGHAWEDYYITLRSSRNLVEGNGLVFQPGERVHTFTSPLGVLVPALCTWIVGPGREEAALWLFRLLGAALLALSCVFAWRRFAENQVAPLARALFFGFMLADSKLADFATNGMETALLVCAVLGLWSELERTAGPRAGAVAGWTAGLMWTRPDAFILGAALLLPHLVFRTRPPGAPAGWPWRPVVRGVLLGGLLYAPWFAWAWWYYGSPIPHTILAKSVLLPPLGLKEFLLIPWRSLTGDSLLMDLFLPTYWFYGDWPAGLKYFGHAIGVLAAFAWLVPALPAAVRRTSLTVFLGMFYICSILMFPWYAPSWTLLSALVLAGWVNHGLGWSQKRQVPAVASALRIAAALVVAVQVSVLVAATWQMRVQQRVIEHGVRRDIGLWLRAQAKPGDSVLMECLGYVGYFSNLKTYDLPGLSSPEVVDVVRRTGPRYRAVIDALRPTWLVLRPHELADPKLPENAVLREYRLVKTWDARPQLDAIPLLPGRGWLAHDARFFVLRHEPADKP